MNTTLSATLPTPRFSAPVTEAQADALLIATGLSHLTEDYYFNEEEGAHYYDLEDGRTVEITARGEVFVYDFTREDAEDAPQQIQVQLAPDDSTTS